jgi:hypothetical protein
MLDVDGGGRLCRRPRRGSSSQQPQAFSHQVSNFKARHDEVAWALVTAFALPLSCESTSYSAIVAITGA